MVEFRAPWNSPKGPQMQDDILGMSVNPSTQWLPRGVGFGFEIVQFLDTISRTTVWLPWASNFLTQFIKPLSCSAVSLRPIRGPIKSVA